MLILGIDPGINGAAGVIRAPADPLGKLVLVDVIDLPTSGEGTKRRIAVGEFYKWLSNYTIDRAYIERAHAMPQQHIASTFRYGRAVGQLEATAIIRCADVRECEARAWKKFFNLDSDKEKSRALAQKMFPAADCFERVKDHQRAEAILIACYGASRDF
jgi:crossover junction endodeoxyribonuclease RuvC